MKSSMRVRSAPVASGEPDARGGSKAGTTHRGSNSGIPEQHDSLRCNSLAAPEVSQLLSRGGLHVDILLLDFEELGDQTAHLFPHGANLGDFSDHRDIRVDHTQL